jgi:lysophospholipase L1-like esterase
MFRRSGQTCLTFILTLLMIAAFAGAQPASQPASQPARGRGGARMNRKPINPALPTLWIIGDSTVLNGQDTGNNGQWGWGNPIASYFDQTKINIQNRALGGTSSRTFWRDQWPRIVTEIKPGDFLIMQFGHNDSSAINDNSRARGTIKNNSDETQEIDNMLTGKHEIVHSYGWYLRQFIKESADKGAVMSIVCSPIPRNGWRNGTLNPDSYGPIAKAAAEQMKMPYIDLNGLIIKKYLALGQEKVTNELFPENEGTHTDWAGAVLNAQCVIEGMKEQNLPITKYLLPDPPKDLKNPMGRAR